MEVTAHKKVRGFYASVCKLKKHALFIVSMSACFSSIETDVPPTGSGGIKLLPFIR